jgi:photosystem II stability/assembly factor-like uncharacterized protein
MRKTTLSFFIISLLVVYQSKVLGQERLDSLIKNQRYVKDIDERQLNDSLFRDENGFIRSDLYRRSMRSFKRAETGPTSFMGNSVKWRQVGPAPALVNNYLAGNGQRPGPNAGAILDLAIDPRGMWDKVIYAVSNNGGVWKSTDGGNLWKPKTDKLGTLSFGAIAIDPTNPDRIFAGTGNLFSNGYFKAMGIYVSHDQGDTWHLTSGSPVLNNIRINKMAMLKTGTLLVATEKGLFRSTNSGLSYHRVMIDQTESGYISDLDIGEDGTTIWVSVRSKGIYKSFNDGRSFGFNLWGKGQGPNKKFYFVSLGVSSNGLVLYANAEIKPRGRGVEVWKSINGGRSWIDISAQANKEVKGLNPRQNWRQIKNCQCGYDQTLGVDPKNSNRVYMGFQDLWLSEDGGDTWKNVSFSHKPGVQPYTKELMHVDHHALVFSPKSHRNGRVTRLWVGNDGGIWSSRNKGNDWENHNADKSRNPKISLATNLFRGIDIGRGSNNNQYTYGGMQDTGSAAGYTSRSPEQPQEWNEWGGGDGGQVAVDWQDPKFAYGIWGNSVIYTHDGGKTERRSNVKCRQGHVGRLHRSSLETNPKDRSIYLSGSCNNKATLFRSTDFGRTYNEYYQFNSDADYVKEIGVTPANSNIVYVSLSNGELRKLFINSREINSKNINIPNAIQGQVPKLAVNQERQNEIVAVYAGYSKTNFPAASKHVYFSRNGGNSWKDISGHVKDAKIPDAPIYAAVFNPNTSPTSILVASDFGVFRTFDYGTTWHVAGKTLPNVHITDLEIDATVTPSLVKAGTYGRSVWESYLPIGTEIIGQLSSGYLNVGTVTWENKTSEQLNVSRVLRSGKQVFYARLAPGKSLDTKSMNYTGVYVLKDTKDNIVLVYIVGASSNQRVTITQTALDLAKNNGLKSYPGLRSYPNADRVRVPNFTAKNYSSQTVHLYRIGSEGHSYKILTLAPGKSEEVIKVDYGDIYSYRNNIGQTLGFFVASYSENQIMFINDRIINIWPKR